MKTCTLNDSIATDSARRYTDDGFLIVPGTLARTGVQHYFAYELGLDSADPMKRIALYRPPEEVFSKDSMVSFEGCPVTIGHPSCLVTSENWAELAKGEAREIKRAGDHMQGIIVIKDKAAIEEVQRGKVELSNGYTFDLDMTQGTTFAGEKYDGIQRNIRGNHVAIVDSARCGSACRISDSKPTEGVRTMTDAKRKVIVDGIPFELDDSAAAAVDKLISERDALSLRVADAESKLTNIKTNDGALTSVEELITLVKDQAAQIESLKKDVMTPEARDAMVADWAKLLDDAKRIAPKVTTDGKTCLQIRREVLQEVCAADSVSQTVAKAVLRGIELDKAEADAVRAAFDAVISVAKVDDGKGTDDAVGRALSGSDSAAQNASQPKPRGREAMMQRQAAAWQNS